MIPISQSRNPLRQKAGQAASWSSVRAGEAVQPVLPKRWHKSGSGRNLSSSPSGEPPIIGKEMMPGNPFSVSSNAADRGYSASRPYVGSLLSR